ncbi:triose-phosphate isomerase [Marinobacter sp. X15-166B]|nr:triose-phosphate isomerase [Marinobacter sp. X15-166B]
MNGSVDLVRDLVGGVNSGLATLENAVEVVIIPPALFFRDVQARVEIDRIALGVQNVSQWQAGAYTGELSARMVRDLGGAYVLVGHSERRQLFGEDDSVVAAKLAQVLASGLTAILCVGETLAEREAGAAQQVVSAQIRTALAAVQGDSWNQIVIAYEPVWAIGTGKTATADDAQAMHQMMRGLLAELDAPAEQISLLYGGSVKPDNAAALFAQPDIDGGLIGGASLVAEDFVSICQSA